jgi:hypothetical protein
LPEDKPSAGHGLTTLKRRSVEDLGEDKSRCTAGLRIGPSSQKGVAAGVQVTGYPVKENFAEIACFV